MAVASHYDTLGVRPTAGEAEIRTAYRRLARRHHPDQAGSATRMAELNEAYRVLRDPARRAAYDASRRAGAAAGPAAAGGPGPGRPAGNSSWGPDSAGSFRAPGPSAPRPAAAAARLSPDPARFPWRLALGMFVVGAIAVVVLAALYEPRAAPPPDNLLQAGSCVVLEPNGDAREVTCGTADERVVAVFVAAGRACPAGTEPHRDRQGLGTACLEPVTGPAGTDAEGT